MATSEYAGYSAPSIDGQALRRQLAGSFLMNIVQGLFHTPGRGIQQAVNIDTAGLEVRVIREKPLTQKARRVGATSNGGYFNTGTPEQPTSEEYGLKVDLLIDLPIDIPEVMQDMLPLDIAQATVRNYEQLVARNINASTIATQLASTFNYNATLVDGGGTATWVEYASATDDILDIFQDAGLQLDDGDVDNGVDTFPADTRIALWRSTGKRAFFKTAKSVLDVGNWKAQDMIRLGTVDAESVRNTDKNGFFGEIDSTYNYFVASAIWNLAVEYLRQSDAPMADTTLDEVVGFMCASMGTARGVSLQSQVKIIDSPQGQGIRMQPKQRWGVEVFYPKSVVAVVTDSFTNPAYPASTVTAISIEAPESNVS